MWIAEHNIVPQSPGRRWHGCKSHVSGDADAPSTTVRCSSAVAIGHWYGSAFPLIVRRPGRQGWVKNPGIGRHRRTRRTPSCTMTGSPFCMLCCQGLTFCRAESPIRQAMAGDEARWPMGCGLSDTEPVEFWNEIARIDVRERRERDDSKHQRNVPRDEAQGMRLVLQP